MSVFSLDSLKKIQYWRQRKTSIYKKKIHQLNRGNATDENKYLTFVWTRKLELCSSAEKVWDKKTTLNVIIHAIYV